MKHLKKSALVLAITAAATSSAMAQSAKVNAWEGFYGQVGVGYGAFNPSISNGTPTYPAPYSAIPAAMSTSNINNVNTVALSKNKALHFWIPSTSLVSEMHTAVEELSHCYYRHGGTLLFR